MKTAIIGGGYAGLSAAWDLTNQGHEVEIFEAADHLGGLADGFKLPEWDWSVERFYHHWFESDEHMLGIIDELGLSDNVLFPRPYTVMNHNDKWYPFDDIIQALIYPGLGWGINKIRFGLVGLYLRFTKNWQTLEKTTVDAWMRKWAGNKVYETMWEPMVIGKFGKKFSKEVNMAWMWARIHARTTRLGTFKGGFQAFADAFGSALEKKGVKIHLSTPITKIESANNSTVKLISNNNTSEFDNVLVTTSPRLFAKLTPSLPKKYLDGLLSLNSMGAIVVTFSLKHQVSKAGYYWYNLPKKLGYPFLAMVEHTNYVSKDHFNGEHILYCGDYLETDHATYDLDDKSIVEMYIEGIKRINPEFNSDWINRYWIHKTKYGQPVPLLNHSQNIPSIETPMKGVYFASMSQVYPWDRGTNFAVEIGRKAATLILQNR
jgi:protoporphyrinogen oxidase